MQIFRGMLLLVNLVAAIAMLYAAIRATEHSQVGFLIAAGFILNFSYILTAPPGRFE
jgi:hypothetical protein